MSSCALHDRLEPAESHRDQLPNTDLSIRPFVDHREPLCLVPAQRQNDGNSPLIDGDRVLDDLRRRAMTAIAERDHADILCHTPLIPDPVSVTMPCKLANARLAPIELKLCNSG